MTSSTFDVAVCCSSDFAQLVQQPRILDGDDRLGGEILQQRNLLVGERPYLLTIYGDCSNKCVFLEHRHNEKCSSTTAINKRDERRRRTCLVGWLRP